MSDHSKSRSHPIPSWQRGEDNNEKTEPRENGSLETRGTPITEDSRSELREQAMKFLDEEGVQNAPAERKIEFLERKGLSNEEIQELLGVSRNTDKSDTASPTGTTQGDGDEPKREPQMPVGFEGPLSTPTAPPLRDAPPIITYPEFLLHSQKPPPLITSQRLLTTFYVVSGAAALTYGTSTYIVEPMIDALTSARHSFAGTAIDNLNALNKKLEATVSVLPDTLQMVPDSVLESLDDTDVNTFFHRSAATQTSPHLSRSNSSSSSSSIRKPSATEEHTIKLDKLREDLQVLLKPASDVQPQDVGVKKDIKQELDSLQTYLSHMEYGGFQPNAGGKVKEDGIAKLKAEIRQTKGVLLSSRNFPSSVAARGWGTAAS